MTVTNIRPIDTEYRQKNELTNCYFPTRKLTKSTKDASPQSLSSLHIEADMSTSPQQHTGISLGNNNNH